MKHTKGTWTVHKPTKTDRRLMVLHPDGERVVCGLNEGFANLKGILSDEEREANAHLIAAAPDLLEVCQVVLNQHLFSPDEVYNIASRTFFKATGAQSHEEFIEAMNLSPARSHG